MPLCHMGRGRGLDLRRDWESVLEPHAPFSHLWPPRYPWRAAACRWCTRDVRQNDQSNFPFQLFCNNVEIYVFFEHEKVHEARLKLTNFYNSSQRTPKKNKNTNRCPHITTRTPEEATRTQLDLDSNGDLAGDAVTTILAMTFQHRARRRGTPLWRVNIGE